MPGFPFQSVDEALSLRIQHIGIKDIAPVIKDIVYQGSLNYLARFSFGQVFVGAVVEVSVVQYDHFMMDVIRMAMKG